MNTLILKQLSPIMIARPASCNFHSTGEQDWYLLYQNRGYIQSKDNQLRSRL